MYLKELIAKDEQSYTICLSTTGEEILILLDNTEVGVIDLTRRKEAKGGESFLITVLDLEKCKRIGIGEASLRFHKEIFHRPLSANGDVREGRHSSENQVTQEGISFIGNMRKKGVIELIDFHGAFDEDE